MLTTPCAHCEATGIVEEVREKTVDDLSGIQFEFLFEADAVREGNTEEQQEELKRQQQRAQQGTARGATGGQPPTSRHNHRPPPNA